MVTENQFDQLEKTPTPSILVSSVLIKPITKGADSLTTSFVAGCYLAAGSLAM